MQKQFFYNSQLSDPSSAETAFPALLSFLTGSFAPNGPWDYKHFDSSEPNHTALKDLGNFTFGAVLQSLGFSYNFTQNAAGIAQVAISLAPNGTSGTGTPFIQYPFGDQAIDAAVIRQGYDYQAAKQAGLCP